MAKSIRSPERHASISASGRRFVFSEITPTRAGSNTAKASNHFRSIDLDFAVLPDFSSIHSQLSACTAGFGVYLTCSRSTRPPARSATMSSNPFGASASSSHSNFTRV